MNHAQKEEDGSYVLNIQPKASVLSVFSRLNYKPWYAIAEFVDNSTQSFYSHEEEFAAAGIFSVDVQIQYDFDTNTLTIKDDAFGMNLKEFSRAVQMDISPQNKNGRNEFGMGLKTAASWFGEKWTVISTRFGETYSFSTEVDIPELKKSDRNTVKIFRTECERSEHGTIIIIKDITKKIDAARTKGKIIEILESMYRRDISSGKVNITFNGSPLHFEEYKCLNFREKTWKKTVDFSFEFESKIYHVKGFAGILAEGGYGKAGFALFRRNRVVIGGNDMNYKPERIFIQPQSTIAHKLFGELDLDDFPVNQAKDGFVWDNGLEDEFVENLKRNIQEYINIAKLTNKQRASEETLSKKSSEEIKKEVEPFVQNISEQNIPKPALFEDESENSGKEFSQFSEFIKETNSQPEKVSEAEREYEIKIGVSKKNFKVKWAIGNDDYWLKVDDSDENEVLILININHSFFKPYSNDTEFKIVLEKFVIAFVVAEQSAKLTSDKSGYIQTSLITNNMNRYLSQISDSRN